MIETKKHFSLFCTYFAIWKHLEAFGSIWKLIVFALSHRFDTETTNQRQQYHKAFKCFQSRFDFETVWKHSEALLFISLICLFTVKTVPKKRKQSASKCFQMLPNASKCFQMLPNASKCFQIAENVQKSEKWFLVSITLSVIFHNF